LHDRNFHYFTTCCEQKCLDIKANKSLPRGKVFQIHGVGLASRKSAGLERGKLCVGCPVIKSYSSGNHFVQNENIFFLEVNARNYPHLFLFS